MKTFVHVLLLAFATLVVVTNANAQTTPGGGIAIRLPSSEMAADPNKSNPIDQNAPPAPAGKVASLGIPLPGLSDSAPTPDAVAQAELAQMQKNMTNLLALKNAAQQDAQKDPQKDPQKDEKLQKQVELLQQQIELQQKMIKLLMDNMQKQPPADKLQTQVATLDARSKQSALRDQELANAVDNIVEHQDALQRNGPALPAGLKELYLPSGNSETVLSIYGALAFGYSKIIGNSATAANGAGRDPTPGGFYFGEFTPDFLLKLNDWIFLEAEIGIGDDGSVGAGSFAQVDFFCSDWLTIIAGRFVAPIGWYNERLNNPFINKLPGDAPGSGPLLWQQVLPPLACLGVEATGAFYLGCSPVKMEYAAYISNGLNLTPGTAGSPTIDEVANLQNMTDTFSFNTNEKAVGGRLGLWWPECGLAGGISGLYNGDYVAGGFEDSISLWAVDLNYHKGNWDARFEYGKTFQQAGSFGFDNIRRQGLYGQLAYRPRDLPNGFLQKTEVVYRYSYVDFKGIDPTSLDLTQYSTPIDVPVRRQQNEIGINYYFSPRLVVKVAYQINDEPGFHLHDNQLITELAWGW